MKYKLGEIFEVGSGGTPSKTHPEYYGGSIPWIKTGDLKNEYLYVAEDYITEEGLNNSSAKMYTPDTVLIAMYGATIGATSILKIDACTNQACAAFKKSEKVIPEYLYYFFKSQKERFVKDGVGGAQPNISAGYLKNVEMEVPTLEEQAQILDILDKTNRIIEDRRNELKELDNLIKSRFVEMFGDPITNDKGWNTVELNSICDGIGDGLHGTPEYDENGEYPFINGNNLMNDAIEITQATKMVNEDTYKKHFIELTDNAILLSINGTLGKLAFYNGEKVMLGKSACYCNLKPEINREFVYGVMKTDAFTGFLETNATASTIKNVGLKAIRGFNLILPPEELQIQFVEFSRQVDKLKFEVQKSLDETQTLMDSLMQQYFG